MFSRMKSLRLAALLTALVLSSPGWSQTHSTSTNGVAASDLHAAFLKAITLDDVGGPSPVNGFWGPIVGREDLGRSSLTPSKICAPAKENPIAAVVAAARATNIVIVNVDSRAPLHQQFLTDIVTALKPEGYSYLAVESLAPQNKNKTYLESQEPMFGRTIRRAKSLEYKVVSYARTDAQKEAQGKTAPSYDVWQETITQNLISAAFKQKSAKVIVEISDEPNIEGDHGPPGKKSPRMASRLAKAIGSNPFTIDQTSCLSGSAKAVGVRGAKGAGADLLVGHPPNQFKNHRPTWRRDAGDVDVAVPAGLLSDPTKRVLIEAYDADANDSSIPADRILIRPGERLPLLLPPGRYRVDSFTDVGKLSKKSVRIEVEKPRTG